MQITHNITMDLLRPGVAEVIRGVQGEAVSRVLCFHLTQNGVAWPIPAGAKAALRFGKPDGTGGIYDTLPDGSLSCAVASNTVSVTLAPQVLSCAGTVSAQLVLRLGESILCGFTVYLLVQPDPSATCDPSGDYHNWLEATREAVSGYYGVHIPENETQLQAFLDAGLPVRVDSTIPLTESIVLRRDNAWLEFGPGGLLDIRLGGFPAIRTAAGSNGLAPQQVTVLNARILGDRLPGSAGLALDALGSHSRVENLTVTRCEYGITAVSARDLELRGLHILNCSVGIYDGGGLDGANIRDGCIRNSAQNAVITASRGLRLSGLRLLGSGYSTFLLRNRTNPDEDVACTVRLSGCSLRQPYEAGQQRGMFRLGDSGQAEGFFGAVTLTGCDLELAGNLLAQCNGDALPDDGESYHGASLKKLTLVACHLDSLPATHLPTTATTELQSCTVL